MNTGWKMQNKQNNPAASQNKAPIKISDNPGRLLLFIAATIFVSELFIMIFVDYMPSMSFYQKALSDAALLTMVIFPILYLGVFKPMSGHIYTSRLREKEKNAFIRDLNKAMSEVKHSEQKFRNLFDNATDSIFIVEPVTGRFLDCNLNAHKRLGFSKDELLKMTATDLNKDLHLDKIKENFQKQLIGESICIETDHKKKDGTYMPVEVTSTAITLGDKKILQAFVRDISERRKREEEKEQLIIKLKNALDEIKTLQGILPLCSFCKKIRNDKGYWEQVDVYLQKYSTADISHGICPECLEKHYPEEYEAMCSTEKET
jgi:PAS domain S-box-containing protein